MKLPSKEEVRSGVQFFLVTYTMIMGFIWEYIWLWYMVDLPMEWWSLAVCALLGLVSAGGLFNWIASN